MRTRTTLLMSLKCSTQWLGHRNNTIRTRLENTQHFSTGGLLMWAVWVFWFWYDTIRCQQTFTYSMCISTNICLLPDLCTLHVRVKSMDRWNILLCIKKWLNYQQSFNCDINWYISSRFRLDKLDKSFLTLPSVSWVEREGWRRSSRKWNWVAINGHHHHHTFAKY